MIYSVLGELGVSAPQPTHTTGLTEKILRASQQYVIVTFAFVVHIELPYQIWVAVDTQPMITDQKRYLPASN